LKIHVRNLAYTLLLEIGGQKPLFSTTLQLNGTFNGLCLPNETWYTQPASALATRRGLMYRLKTTWTRLQTGPPSLPTLRIFRIL